jgi:hypothetical protein
MSVHQLVSTNKCSLSRECYDGMDGKTILIIIRVERTLDRGKEQSGSQGPRSELGSSRWTRDFVKKRNKDTERHRKNRISMNMLLSSGGID